MTTSTAILLAEDEDTDAILMLRAFRNARIGNQLLRVRDGDEVLDYLMGNGVYANRNEFPIPCLLLLDLKMPRRNGFEVLSWIRSQPGLKRLLITVLTSSDEKADIKRAYDLGANSYLRKPADFRELIEMIKSLQTYWKIIQMPRALDPENVHPNLLSAEQPNTDTI
jgi:CheY-like chemotaxis protein